MSDERREDRRKVIHVRDLVIKADNVFIEPTRRSHRDPFFGGRRDDRDERDHRDHMDEDVESASHEHDHGHDHHNDDDRGDRRPFSWI
ncbi:hypothetical protein [Virgibacillus ndiopensis]|uniref:hypothetical protein n=1 Tax=Virgibacillus ndiopensis TaxID=2004408 RepID=UPI000C073D40|nr:hypothetical protein [Virgibacillus ndiopensis]